jgi:CDP-diacylglycerol--glycerol-3-phosphate 3-phosphatidyltransferase
VSSFKVPPPPPDRAGDPIGESTNLNLPNALTLVRLLLVPLFAVLLLSQNGDNTTLRLWAAFVFAIASVTDLLDGYLARKHNLVTNFGKIADPIADKLLTGTALVGLSIIGRLPWWITVVILVREIGVTILRFWVIRHGVIPASRGGKLKTILQMYALFGYILPISGAWFVVAEVLMYAAVIVTVVTGVDYIVKAVRLRRKALAEQ